MATFFVDKNCVGLFWDIRDQEAGYVY